jgi:hypothetical protein
MSTKPDVRPAGPNHPNPAKREKKLHPPVEVRELISDAAQALFNERGGKRLVQSLDSIEGALFTTRTSSAASATRTPSASAGA